MWPICAAGVRRGSIEMKVTGQTASDVVAPTRFSIVVTWWSQSCWRGANGFHTHFITLQGYTPSIWLNDRKTSNKILLRKHFSKSRLIFQSQFFSWYFFSPKILLNTFSFVLSCFWCFYCVLMYSLERI